MQKKFIFLEILILFFYLILPPMLKSTTASSTPTLHFSISMLFYVAITRARDKLLISACRSRRRQNSVVESQPSRFLDEIPPHLVQYHEPEKEVDAETALDILQQMKKRCRNLNFYRSLWKKQNQRRQRVNS